MLLLVALAVGGLIPIQTAANSRLRASVGNKPVMPALISFSSALFFAVVATTVLRGNPVPQFSADVPWWGWLGGVMGVCFVLGNILLFPRLGALETVVLPILGQVVMGLLVDRFGLLGAPAMPVSWMRVLGAAVVFAGIVVVLRSGRRPVLEGDAEGLELAIFRVLGVLVGVCTAIQTSVNGYMGGIAGSSMHAGEINLAVGAVLLLVAALVTSPRQLARRPEPGPWWMWLGGLVGATFVISGATLAPLLGTATTVIAFNAGTIAAGQALEARGAFGARKNPLTATRLAGLVVIFLGVLAVRLL
ncbi:bacterial/archaeal transporter family-2 protein [Corynebacterium afermentans]|uniref:DMT family transporter n=2 Tax=Corynebacterium afermentans TaxID=38286 RepID=UPI0025738F3E|nr:DMT family transporter [Corynebacterium afermentans]MCG7274519.1 DMT family transporter [Corynebacterium afermentans]